MDSPNHAAADSRPSYNDLLARIELLEHELAETLNGGESAARARRAGTEEEFKLIERALAQSELRFQNIYQNSPLGIAVVNSTDLKLLKANPCFCAFIGYTEAELQQLTVPEITYPQDLADEYQQIDSVLTGRQSCYMREKRYICKNGELRWGRLTASLLDQGLGVPPLIFGFVEDVTERRFAVEAMCESEIRIRTLMNQSPDIIMQIDREGRCVFVNTIIERLTGLPISQIVGKTPRELGVDSSLCQFFDESIQSAYNLGRPSETEFTYKLADKAYVLNWRLIPEFDNHGNIRNLLSIARDITEHRQTAEQYQLLFNQMLNGFALHEIILDEAGRPHDYRFLQINPAFERMTGMKTGDVVGRTVRELIPDLEPFWLETYGETALTGRPVRFEKHFPLFDKFFEIQAFSPRPGQFACLIQDITERISAEKERHKLEDQLFQAQKMEAIGQLAGGLAHDFNNLLQVIIGFCDVALCSIKDGMPGYPELDQILSAANSASGLIRQLLTFSRRETIRTQPLDLNEQISATIKMLGRTLGASIRIHTHIAEDLRLVNADAGQTEQVLLNLCLNARDAMPSGGQIHITTSNLATSEEFRREHPWAVADHYVQLVVADTGTGIAPQIKERIFEPFFTTKGQGKGSGLGLATVYGIIKNHDGMIVCDSRLGEGTSFTVYLPALPPGTAAGGIESVGVEMHQLGGTETLLVADDDEIIRSLIQRVLSQAGYRVMLACDGREALDLYEAHSGEIDLVLLDVVMPELDGGEVAGRILRQNPTLPVIFSSGNDFEFLNNDSLENRKLRMLHKPYTPTKLLAMIRSTLDAPADR